jgi:hypothetical protein
MCGYWISHFRKLSEELRTERDTLASRVHNQREEIVRLEAAWKSSFDQAMRNGESFQIAMNFLDPGRREAVRAAIQGDGAKT